MPGLKIRDVYKTFGSNIEVLNGVNLEVEQGQFLILVGNSGCGKSTLLNMIAGLETITRGEIEIGGRVVNDLPPKSRDIAMVFQSYALYPSMTVKENISFGLEIRKVPLAERSTIVARVAEMLQISDLLDRRPRLQARSLLMRTCPLRRSKCSRLPFEALNPITSGAGIYRLKSATRFSTKALIPSR